MYVPLIFCVSVRIRPAQLLKKATENLVKKGENADDLHLDLLFQPSFISPFQVIFTLLSASTLNLDLIKFCQIASNKISCSSEVLAYRKYSMFRKNAKTKLTHENFGLLQIEK